MEPPGGLALAVAHVPEGLLGHLVQHHVDRDARGVEDVADGGVHLSVVCEEKEGSVDEWEMIRSRWWKSLRDEQ